MAKLGMGVLGVGGMGQRHAFNIRSLIPEAKLVAVADANLKRAEQVATELEVEHFYDNVSALAERKDIDAIVVVTPAKFHGAAMRVCAQAGKDIFCEKPFTLTLEEADEMLDLTTKAALYARAAIPEYWILDIAGRRLLVHRNPEDGQYASVESYSEQESLASLAKPDSSFAVHSVFPE